MDGAFFGSFTYVLAHKKLGIKVIARPVGLDGSSTYYGVIFVRKDGGITNVAGMKGKRLVLVDKATTAGYSSLWLFQRAGIEDYRTYIKEAYFAGTHEDAIYDVLNKKADIGAAKNTILDRMRKREAGVDQKMKILAISRRFRKTVWH